MSDFYRAFEDLHRGARESIKERLRVYLPFLKPWQEIEDQGMALDLGCGRGEWIELLSENNFNTLGVDLDEGMLDEARLCGLKVMQQDALAALAACASSSCCVISAFHVVEHIEFDSLRKLVEDAHRALRPGGLLILETPNPANLVVSSNNFYIDPTHVRPIPLELLEFVVGYSGFERVKKIGLHGWAESTEKIALIDVLGGVAPDGAIVAQKNGDETFLAQFDRAFRTPRGYSLGELAEKYEYVQRVRIEKLHEEIEALHVSLNLEMTDLRAIFASRSWRWTKPFRDVWEIARKVKHLGHRLIERLRIKRMIKKMIRAPYVYVRSTPTLNNGFKRILNKLGLLDPLRKLIRRTKKNGKEPASVADLETLLNKIDVGTGEGTSVPYARIVTSLASREPGKADENRL